jgi:hypothetical protein
VEFPCLAPGHESMLPAVNGERGSLSRAHAVDPG